jgi:threonine dehydrogenase-like Zn-dependent dehydrogenase
MSFSLVMISAAATGFGIKNNPIRMSINSNFFTVLPYTILSHLSMREITLRKFFRFSFPNLTPLRLAATTVRTMKAVVFQKPGEVTVEEVPDPKIQEPTDAILKITSTAICGSDLHLYNGFNPAVKKGDIFGHEFMGEIVEVGSGVKDFKKGDRVIVPFPVGCGKCFFCKNNLWTLCDNTNPNKDKAEAMMGYSPAGLYGYSHLVGIYPGGQAEFARVLDVDTNLFKVPDNLPDEKVLFLTDVFPTGYMAAEFALDGIDIQTVGVWGLGPVGQFTIASLKLLGAKRVIGIDKVPERLQMASDQGAEVINFEKDTDVIEKLKELTDRRGPDAVVDAVGMESESGKEVAELYDKAKQAIKLETDRPIALREAIQACRKGGVVSLPGVFTGFADKIPMGSFMNKGLTMRAAQTPVQKYVKKLLSLVVEEKIDPSFIITHTPPLSEAPDAYKMFRDKKDGCVKVVLKP